MKLLRIFLLGLALALPLASVAQSQSYTLSMLPVHSTDTMQAFLHDLGKYLSDYIGESIKIQPVLAKNFDSYLSMVRNGQVDLAFSNPYIYLQFEDLHQALAVADRGEGLSMQGFIVVRRDSPIQALADLQGKIISAVHSQSLGGYIAPMAFLLENNIRLARIEFAANNSHENVLFSTFYGDADAGFIASFSLESANQYLPPNSLRVLAKTASLPSWIFSASHKVPSHEKSLLRQALLVISELHPAMRAGSLKSFTSVNSRELESLRQLKATYERLK